MDKDNISGFTSEPTKQNYDVEVFSGHTRLGVITVSAESPEDASNVAVRDINVKIRRNYG